MFINDTRMSDFAAGIGVAALLYGMYSVSEWTTDTGDGIADTSTNGGTDKSTNGGDSDATPPADTNTPTPPATTEPAEGKGEVDIVKPVVVETGGSTSITDELERELNAINTEVEEVGKVVGTSA